MSRDHVARYSFAYDDQAHLRAVAAAIEQEVGEIDDDRSTARLERDGRRLHVVVEADDLVALRAATNTWLSLVDVAERVAGAAGADPNA